MKKTSLQQTFDQFEELLDWYVDFIGRIIRAQRVVGRVADKKELLQALALRLVSLWETYVEELLVDCLNRDCTQYGKYMGLRLSKDAPRDVCRAMLTGLGYLDFRSTADLQRKARNVLVQRYNPFKAIPKPARVKIDEFLHVRNYIAHQSMAAKRALMADYRNNHSLTYFKKPGDFLWATNPKTKRIRLADYVIALADSWVAMRAELGC
ncbi:MAG: hypothetical protein MUP15_07930 [Dehalococcoidia bacterium]|nr:hypothetical protein [Dehalococcoidia bacterium]